MAEVHENAYRSSLAAASSIATGSTGAPATATMSAFTGGST